MRAFPATPKYLIAILFLGLFVRAMQPDEGQRPAALDHEQSPYSWLAPGDDEIPGFLVGNDGLEWTYLTSTRPTQEPEDPAGMFDLRPTPHLDQISPDRANYLTCLWTKRPPTPRYPDERYVELQQSITVGLAGILATIEVATGAGIPAEFTIGLTRGRPWVADAPTDDTATFAVSTTGDIYDWTAVDLTHLGWRVRPGDKLTLHFWPLEYTCIGFNYFMAPNYNEDRDQMWYSRKAPGEGGYPWGCGPIKADLSFKLSVWPSDP